MRITDVSAEQLADNEQFKLIEEQAFRFGAAFLLPERPFLDDLYSVSLDALRSMKLKWKVSISMMVERLKDIGIVNSDQHRKLRIGYNTRKWNRAEPYEEEIPAELPTVFMKCVELMASRQLQSIPQISAHTGLSPDWIGQLIAVPIQSERTPQLKLVETKQRA